MQRNRPGLIAFFAVLTEIVVIAAAGNQSVARTITNHVGTNPSSFPHRALAALLSFTWRFSPPAGEPAQHLWGAQFAGIGAFLLLTYLLVLAATRGSAGLGQAFLGVWVAVVVAAVGGAIVRGVVYPFSIAKGSRLSVGVFDAPNGEVTLFGAGCGLIVALIAIMVAASSRRAIEPAPGVAGEDVDGPPPEQFFEQPPEFSRPGLAAPAAAYAPAPAYAPPPRVSELPDYDRPSYSGPGYPAAEPARSSSAQAAPDSPTEAVPTVDAQAPAEQTPDQQTVDAQTPTEQAPEQQAADQQAADQQAPEQQTAVIGYTGGEQHTTELPRVVDEPGERPAR